MLNRAKVRARARVLYRAALGKRRNVRDELSLRRSAVVFAPHPDDETLACGGTIVRKIRAGARVRLVVMTDGGSSHRGLLPEQELCALRAREVKEAAARLGVAEGQVDLFGFRDRELDRHVGEATERAGVILREESPEEVYVPYVHEPPADHIATREAALRAVAVSLDRALVYEYPVWFWNHWPWVSSPLLNRREVFAVAHRNARAGIRTIRHLRDAVFIGDVMAQKRHALEAYASQLQRRGGDPGWPTLSDVAGGEFLECFFQEYELFWRWQFVRGSNQGTGSIPMQTTDGETS